MKVAWYCDSLNNALHAQVARCTKIIKPGTEEAKYVINVKQIAKVLITLLAKPGMSVKNTYLPIYHWSAASRIAELPVLRVQFVVGLGDRVAPTDIEEGMRVG